MNITISKHLIGNESINSIDARKLHQELEIKKDYSNWIKDQIKRARLVKDRDYLVYAQKGENLKGGRPTNEYILTLDSAKHICMISSTDKGFEIRDYFIECEKKLAHQNKSISKIQALQMALDAEIKLEEANNLIELQNHKVEYFDALVDKNLLTNFRDTAKELHLGQKYLINSLMDKGYIYRDKNNDLKPYIQYVPKLFEIKEWSNSKKAGTQTMVTPKGRETFRLLLNSEVV
ncbi:antA/AntB antirepressor family protein [Francisella uliginis]|uniref:Antirepressor n=1 Tax=Francisella uliginis TaxID=573570 RepID=A0A1L4BPS6_9GAMM|nr:antA/AntB antirepressor family protein [Francisella uliginis]API85848.1 hypothetical protein F7310_00085 [Francisella uliginis]